MFLPQNNDNDWQSGLLRPPNETRQWERKEQGKKKNKQRKMRRGEAKTK